MNSKRQTLNIVIIVVGAALLIYDLTGENENVYLKIIGLVLLMFGLYTATQQWVAGNEENENEDEPENDVKNDKNS